jgi:hypothetical protein
LRFVVVPKTQPENSLIPSHIPAFGTVRLIPINEINHYPIL